MTDTGGFERPRRRAETALLLAQTAFYIVGILAIFALAALFYGHMVSQQRYHDRQDKRLEEALRESRILLKDHADQEQVHQRLLRQP